MKCLGEVILVHYLKLQLYKCLNYLLTIKKQQEQIDSLYGVKFIYYVNSILVHEHIYMHIF